MIHTVCIIVNVIVADLSGGKRKAPPKAEKLVEFHLDVVKKAIAKHPDHPLILAGKSMGSRCYSFCPSSLMYLRTFILVLYQYASHEDLSFACFGKLTYFLVERNIRCFKLRPRECTFQRKHQNSFIFFPEKNERSFQMH